MTDHLLLTGPLHHYRATLRAKGAGDVPVSVVRSMGEIIAPDIGSARLVAEIMAGRFAPAALGWDVETMVEEVRDAD